MSANWELYRGKPRLINFTSEIMELNAIGYSLKEIQGWIYTNKKWNRKGLEFCTPSISRLIKAELKPIPKPNVMIANKWNAEGLAGVAA